jgi:hypothetical protein
LSRFLVGRHLVLLRPAVGTEVGTFVGELRATVRTEAGSFVGELRAAVGAEVDVSIGESHVTVRAKPLFFGTLLGQCALFLAPVRAFRLGYIPTTVDAKTPNSSKGFSVRLSWIWGAKGWRLRESAIAEVLRFREALIVGSSVSQKVLSQRLVNKDKRKGHGPR